MRHLNDLRCDLVNWGQFWFRKKQLGGWPSKSVTARLCETLKTECYTVGTSHQVAHMSESIEVPEKLREIDLAVNKLNEEQRAAIIKKYQREYLGRKHESAVRALESRTINRAESNLQIIL